MKLIIWFKQLALVLAAGLLFTGCSSTIPDLIKQPPKDDLRVDEVQQRQDAFIDSTVRWGGSIIQVENLPDKTLIEVLARQLNKQGKPDADSRSQGRFKIKLSGFHEPKEFPKDRLLTVQGKISAVTEGPVGSYSYPYPIITPNIYYLWAEEKPDRYPYYHDPFYYHWYPYWYRHPYHWYWY